MNYTEVCATMATTAEIVSFELAYGPPDVSKTKTSGSTFTTEVSAKLPLSSLYFCLSSAFYDSTSVKPYLKHPDILPDTPQSKTSQHIP